MPVESRSPLRSLSDLSRRIADLAIAPTDDGSALAAAADWLLGQALAMYAFSASDHIENALTAFCENDIESGRQHLTTAAGIYPPNGA